MSKQYKNPALTTDVVLFSIMGDCLNVLLIKRKYDPFKDKWAIPGGFVDYEEELYDAAKRELLEETNVCGVELTQVGAFGKVGRDPRGRTVSVVYFACINPSDFCIKAQDDAKEARWFGLNNLPMLAFDHEDIITATIEALKSKVEDSTIIAGLLPKNYSLDQKEKIQKIILGTFAKIVI
jgi:8-oxo-dGTP diphosphatase